MLKISTFVMLIDALLRKGHCSKVKKNCRRIFDSTGGILLLGHYLVLSRHNKFSEQLILVEITKKWKQNPIYGAVHLKPGCLLRHVSNSPRKLIFG
jgi:hypothetical protein